MDHLNQLFIEAGTLMLAGMVFVFAFLGLMIVFINTVLVSLAKKYPDVVAQPANSKVITLNGAQPDSIPPNIIAAISSAVNSYRQQNKISK